MDQFVIGRVAKTMNRAAKNRDRCRCKCCVTVLLSAAWLDGINKKGMGIKKVGQGVISLVPPKKLEVYFKLNATIAALSFRFISLSEFNALTA